MEIIAEAMFGKKFKLLVTTNGTQKEFLAMATANAKPGERPYRITWFQLPENRHVDLTFDEMKNILDIHGFPPEIVKRIQDRYPNDDSELLGDRYQIGN